MKTSREGFVDDGAARGTLDYVLGDEFLLLTKKQESYTQKPGVDLEET